MAIVLIHLLGAMLALACSVGGLQVGGVAVFALTALWIFALQWLAFVPAYLRQTEKFYDLIGSITFVSAVLLAVALSDSGDARSLLLTVLVVVWAARLGSFLFRRIAADGHDSRFDKVKPDAVLFLRTWSLQGLWVLVTAAAALAAITGGVHKPLGVFALVGLLLWLTGFVVEVVADRQKRVFRARHGAGRFIDEGLWARSRHPNYFGEILLWLGVALIALPVLQDWQHVALISPLFVYVLLTRISGIPLLERKSDRRWGEQPEYLAYKARTPVLFPRLF